MNSHWPKLTREELKKLRMALGSRAGQPTQRLDCTCVIAKPGEVTLGKATLPQRIG